MPVILKKNIHPLLLISAIAVWFLFDQTESAVLVSLFSIHIILHLLEKIIPARQDWHQKPKEKATIIGITIVDAIFAGFIVALYSDTLLKIFTVLRKAAGTDLWPAHWHPLAQLFLLFFAAEFVFYWIHRFIHQWRPLWRFSAHGFHHSFKNLHAINFQAAHPLEMFFVVFPTAFVSLMLGVPPEIIAGANVLGTVNSAIAHANIDAENKWVGWIFTTSAQHRRHHSMEYNHSNSNYSCKAIIFDRIFGTFSEGPVEQTGIGPLEPTLLEKLLLPLREPSLYQKR